MGTDASLLDVTRLLGPERSALLDLLGGLAPADWELSTECPRWSVKGIALHVLGDDLSLLTRQRDRRPTASLCSPSIIRARASGNFSTASTKSGSRPHDSSAAVLVIDMLRLVGEWSADFYCNIGLDTISREPVGFFAVRWPFAVLAGDRGEYIERFVHQSQIRRAVVAADLEGELVSTAARVVVHALARWLRNYAPATGWTIAIEFGAAGTFTWRRESSHWSVLDGEPADCDARVTIASERTVAMLSRGVSYDEARSCMTVGGDGAVAGPALELVAADPRASASLRNSLHFMGDCSYRCDVRAVDVTSG